MSNLAYQNDYDLEIESFKPVHQDIKEAISEAIEDIGSCEFYSFNVEEIEHKSRDGFWAWTDGGWNAIAMTDLGYLHGSGYTLGNEETQQEIQRMIDYSLELAAESFIEHRESELIHLFNNTDVFYNEVFDADDIIQEIKTKDTTLYQVLDDLAHEQREIEKAQLKLFEGMIFINKYEQLLDDFYEYENDAMTEQSEVYVVLRAAYYGKDNSRNETGQDEVCFFSGINTDSYGRDKYIGICKEITMPVAELNQDKIQDIVKQLTEVI